MYVYAYMYYGDVYIFIRILKCTPATKFTWKCTKAPLKVID